MSSDSGTCSDPTIQKSLKGMPVDIQRTSECFREVAKDLRTKVKIPGENSEQAVKRRNDWDLYSEEFDDIVIEMHHIATTGAQCIDDFVKSYCVFLSKEDETVESKIKKLKQFKETLCNIFGTDGEILVSFTKKINTLGRKVLIFGIELTCLPGNSKEDMEKGIEELKAQMHRIDSEIDSRKLASVSWGLFFAPFTSLQYILGIKQPSESIYSEQDSSIIFSKEFEREELNKKLQDKQEVLKKLYKCWKELDSATGECCEKIESINVQLNVVKRVWMTLNSDAEGLLIQLKLSTDSDDNDVRFFNIRLENLEKQYTKVHEALDAFTHFKNAVLAQSGKKEGGRTWKPWFWGQ